MTMNKLIVPSCSLKSLVVAVVIKEKKGLWLCWDVMK